MRRGLAPLTVAATAVSLQGNRGKERAVKTRLLVALLLVLCFTLAGALYATAAPSTVPGQIYDLKVKVKQLRLRLDEVTAHLADVECRTQFNEQAIILLSHGESLGDTRYCVTG